jgi:predicted transposase/invertase (TIGR01784 family)
MQVRATAALQSRLLLYAARDFANQAKRGHAYDSLTPTVLIVWLVQPLFADLHQLHSIFELRERNTQRYFSRDLALHVLQLSEIPEQPAQDLTLPEHRVQLWARFLAARTPEDRAALAQEDSVMASAIENLEQLSADPELVRQAEERQLSRFFYELSLVNAKQEGLLEGKQVGLLEGKQVGLLEGKQVGLLEGKRETLLLLLQAKFDAVPPSLQARLQSGTDAELTRWAARLLKVQTIDEVFGG